MHSCLQEWAGGRSGPETNDLDVPCEQCRPLPGACSRKDPRDERHRGLVHERLPRHVLPVHGSMCPLPGAGRETRARACNGSVTARSDALSASAP